MNIVNSAFMLWVGLTSLIPKSPGYEIENFYTYDREHKKQPLLLQKKVFMPLSKEGKAYLVTIRQASKQLTIPNPGWVISCEDNVEALALMEQMTKANIVYKPIVQWEGMDCLPSNTLIIKTKPFVTEKLLRQHLELAKIDILQMGRNDEQEWIVEVKDAPVNMLVLANMIAEDTVWIEWAKVQFVPLHSPISGTMEISPAVLNLGYDKQLHVVITVYKPSIKVRKDLMPKLGENRFIPTPQKDDVWYDFGQTTITEEHNSDKTIIRMTTPFRYLAFGTIIIQPIEVAYDDGKVPGTFWIAGVDYRVQSVIAGTDINDIQPMPSSQLMPTLSVPVLSKVTLWPWRKIALVNFGFGVFLLMLFCGVMEVIVSNQERQEHAAKASKDRLWQELTEAVKLEGDWRVVYMDTSDKLANVLEVFYNIKMPISSEEAVGVNLRCILFELEKLYEPDPCPDVKILLTYVNLFVVEKNG